MRRFSLLWIGMTALSTSCGSSGHVSTGVDAGTSTTADAGNGAGSSGGDDGDDGGGAAAQDAAAPAPQASCVSAAQLQKWVQEIDTFDGGYRPTGSPAHEGYISRLASELTAVGVSDVHTEPYSYMKWTPSTWSLTLLDGPSPGAVTLSGYVPYSGVTVASGVTSGLVYVPASTIPIDPTALSKALQDPTTWNQNLQTELQGALASLGVAGKIALFDVPQIAVALTTLTGTQVLVNDPGHTLPSNATVTRTDLSAMLIVPAMLSALAAEGALGGIGILDDPEEAARGEYAPFFGVVSPNLPSVYVDRTTGASLQSALTVSGPLLSANLVLLATLATATSENLVGTLPGDSTQELILGSHTDGTNSMEDNGPAAILALASCMPAKRPRTVSIVLSGGHFVGSKGLQTYVAAHTTDLTADALAVVEIEHLGAREWTEVSPGVMGLTGLPEVQVITTWPNAPLVAAGKAFGELFPRSIVGGPPLLGEGHNFSIVPLIQFITMPEYLLVGQLPAITSQFTDFGLMGQQVDAFAAMMATLQVAPAGQLGVH
jgi:hypothetical protein